MQNKLFVLMTNNELKIIYILALLHYIIILSCGVFALGCDIFIEIL